MFSGEINLICFHVKTKPSVRKLTKIWNSFFIIERLYPRYPVILSLISWVQIAAFSVTLKSWHVIDVKSPQEVVRIMTFFATATGKKMLTFTERREWSMNMNEVRSRP